MIEFSEPFQKGTQKGLNLFMDVHVRKGDTKASLRIAVGGRDPATGATQWVEHLKDGHVVSLLGYLSPSEREHIFELVSRRLEPLRKGESSC